MNNYKYTLEPHKGMESRYTCPSCGKTKSFTRYIDTETKKHISDEVGRCNRENSCKYHYTPKQYFKDNNIKATYTKTKESQVKEPEKTTSVISEDIMEQSLKQYERNNFVKYLVSLFGETVTKGLISKYFIGTSKHWENSTVFWQMDIYGKIRTGKIMLYNSDTCKRVKEPHNYITWVHSVMSLPNFNLEQCFFGEHLLKEKNKPVAIVESEKTAVIASVYLPQFVWLAAGGLSNLSEEKFEVLEGRKVVLYPDLGGSAKWYEKAKDFLHIADISFSDILEERATKEEKELGYDLADYLVNFKP